MAKLMLIGEVAKVEIMPADDEGSLGAICFQHGEIDDLCEWTIPPQYTTDDLIEIAEAHADGRDR